MKPLLTVLTAALTLSLCTMSAASAAPEFAGRAPVRLLGVQTVPNGLEFDGTTVGGLSSIEYDPRAREYVLLSDDRSNLQPSRFYTATVDVRANGLGDVTFTGTHPLTGPDGAPYAEGAVDPEELRVDPWYGTYYWSQEGTRSETVLADPSVREATRAGAYVRDLPLPANLRMTEDAGPRNNQVLEAMTFAERGTRIVTALEGPLLEDGERSTPEHAGLSRITMQNRDGRVLAQYAYRQEPAFAEPEPGGEAGNGVVSILATGRPQQYLVLERAFVSGAGNRVRIFEIDLRGATDVQRVPSLADPERPVRPTRKRLLVDLADLPLDHVDNVEGITWGPWLPTGERTLVLVSDDNFSTGQVTQVIALAVRDRR